LEAAAVRLVSTVKVLMPQAMKDGAAAQVSAGVTASVMVLSGDGVWALAVGVDDAFDALALGAVAHLTHLTRRFTVDARVGFAGAAVEAGGQLTAPVGRVADAGLVAEDAEARVGGAAGSQQEDAHEGRRGEREVKSSREHHDSQCTCFPERGHRDDAQPR
jgi:hypothetical protein